MAKQHNFTVGNHSFTMRVAPFSEGRPLFIKLLKNIGPTLASALEGKDESGLLKTKKGNDMQLLDMLSGPLNKKSLDNVDVDLKVMFRILGEFIEYLEDADVAQFYDFFCKHTDLNLDGRTVPFNKGLLDETFAGDYLGASKFLASAITNQFFGFLSSRTLGGPAAA